jgi:hypothetical protein
VPPRIPPEDGFDDINVIGVKKLNVVVSPLLASPSVLSGNQSSTFISPAVVGGEWHKSSVGEIKVDTEIASPPNRHESL